MIPELISKDFTGIELVNSQNGLEQFTGIKLGSSSKVLITVDTTKNPQTYMEAKIMRDLSGEEGIPRLEKYGKCESCFFSVIKSTGKSLEQLKEYLGGKISPNLALSFGLQVLCMLERLHFRGFVHRNLHPSNICVSVSKNTMKFGDLKYAKRIDSDHFTRSYEQVGTPVFASLNSHLRYSLSQRDDLESLAYILIYCLKGLLPWGKLADEVDMHQWHKAYIFKANISIQELCSECPKTLVDFLNYARNLRYEQSPDYEYLKALLKMDEHAYNIPQGTRYGSLRQKTVRNLTRNRTYRKKRKATVSEVTDVGHYPMIKNRKNFNIYAKIPKPLENQMSILFCI